MNRIRSRCLCIFSLSLLSIQGGTGELPKISPAQPFTFVVLGDNRGDDSGQQPFAFKAVLDSVKAQAPVLILDSGDMIYGHTSNARRMREQWRIYRKAIAKIHIPIFHVPGNHDLWNEPSADFYRTLWGPTYYAFSFGNSRFIGLDTETITGQIEGEQFQWLQKQLIECSDTNIFLFMHRPLFPVDGGIGSSLDKYPGKRDRLHDLFVQHR
ncbi:MAG TPA: metallophosphoesterase, partial [Patescibacteria group bacterium]|nr:metallophosphoesterase [Patescibacteria group bacterium]